jgi:hypothetical protein
MGFCKVIQLAVHPGAMRSSSSSICSVITSASLPVNSVISAFGCGVTFSSYDRRS